jgi:anti-anti-sigma factor
MRIDQVMTGEVYVCAPAGRIDTTTSPSVEGTLKGAVDGGVRSVVVDFDRVEYISSAGLRVFLLLAKRMRDLRGRLVLCGMPEPVRQVFHLAGFMPLFEVERTRADALVKLTSPT